MAPQTDSRVIFTNPARCRNCYRCLRMCPVKAIRIENGQAHVEASLCLACGTCRRECPQQAKVFRSDLDRVQYLLSNHTQVAVSLAPSYASVYPSAQRGQMLSALRHLGFAYIEETALGAEITAHETAESILAHAGQPAICSACPAVVNYIEMYKPELVPQLVPVVSPMIAHARLMKKRYGAETPVVFIGPCLAKKVEAERPEYAGLVDAVLTFAELDAWLQLESINLETLPEGHLDVESNSYSRYFPILGGLAKTAGFDTDLLEKQTVAISGFEMIEDILTTLTQAPQPWIIEPLFCREGCINGPGITLLPQVYEFKKRLLDYASTSQPPSPLPLTHGLYQAHYHAKPMTPTFSEEDILRVLEQTGKSAPEDQLNCAACGYNSCRDKAIAVLNHMAEPEMCVPQMIRRAEQRTDKVIETTPNGIVTLDDHLHILSMNLAFRQMFQATDAVLGKPISYLLDPGGFEKLATRTQEKIEGRVTFPNYHLVCHQILYPLKDDRQYVGIYVNLTYAEDTERVLKTLKQETLRQSQELLDHQIRMAQDLVAFLGENTAKAEQLVKHLAEAAMADPPTPPPARPGD